MLATQGTDVTHACISDAIWRWRRAPPRRARIDTMPVPPQVLLLDSDSLTQSMIAEWLDADGWQVLEPAADAQASDLSLVVIDLPFPRAGALDALQAIRQQYPGVPVIVISSTVFANVGCGSSCAASLGVSGVLPKPIARDVLLGAVRRLARPGIGRAGPP